VILLGFMLPSCSKEEGKETNQILGFDLLNKINGHWIGTNETPFGYFDWFAFDFRPISASHSHSIYEGATNQNIIISIFLGTFEGKQQVMARNGGWLGNQYRATYFVLDREEKDGDIFHYRLVDAVGGEDRAYIEFSFVADSMYMDAYKDNSGSLDKPIHHMGFAGINANPDYAESARAQFDYPQMVAEVDLTGKFVDLIDTDSALFLDEAEDPFPRSAHGYLSDLIIDVKRNEATNGDALMLYLSKEEIISSSGNINFNALNNSVIRTIGIQPKENAYTTTYLHPDEYYLTVFSDTDNNGIPSAGEYSSFSIQSTIKPERLETEELEITTILK